MSINSSWNQLLGRFRDKEYRDLFVAEQIYSRLPLKIRSLREERQLTQKKLGEMATMKQTWVSKLEDPNYGKLTISTLLKVASALDVGLYIDFVPFSEVLNRTVRLSPESFSVPSCENDLALQPRNEPDELLNAPLPRALRAALSPNQESPAAALGFSSLQSGVIDITMAHQFSQSRMRENSSGLPQKQAREGVMANGTVGNSPR